ncbi:hypothetical protein MASR2M66_21190 [Chloroflexota bacterium]
MPDLFSAYSLRRRIVSPAISKMMRMLARMATTAKYVIAPQLGNLPTLTITYPLSNWMGSMLMLPANNAT